MRFLQPVTKIFFFPFLSNHRRDSFWKITYTMDEWEIAIKRDLPFFLPFEYTISRLSNTDTSPSRSSRKPHTPLPELLLQVYTNFSLATRRLIARLYPYLNSISLSLSPRNELLSRPSFDKTNRDYFQKLELFLLNPIRLSSLRNNLIKEFINTKLFARWFLSNFLVVHKHETVRSLISLSRRTFSTFLNVLNKLVTTRGDF